MIQTLTWSPTIAAPPTQSLEYHQQEVDRRAERSIVLDPGHGIPWPMELRPVQRRHHRSSAHIQSDFWTVSPISKTQFGFGSCLHISDPMMWVSSTSHPNWIIWMDPNFTHFTPEEVSNLSHDMDQVDQAEGLQSGAIHGSYGQGP